jgi:3'-5' exoribonuclease
VWENVERVSEACDVGGVVEIAGQVQRYNQNLQVVVQRAQAVDPGQVDESLFVRASKIDPELLWNQLMACVEDVEDGDLKQLLFRVFSDPQVSPAFKHAPAARGMHHAFKAGLVEHTVSMARLARGFARHYGVNEDLVVAGALLHDLGKVWELELKASIDYTDDGRLLGHLPMTVLFIDRQIAQLERFPAETRRQLLHILLAHHGEYQYGSPRRPKTPEALLVYHLDNLDSRMAGMLEAIAEDGDSEAAWSAYSKILERHVYRRSLPAAGRGKKDRG